MRSFFLCTIALMTLLLTGCGDSHEKVMSQAIKNQKKLNDALEKATESDDAAVAAGEALSNYLEELARIHAKADKLGTPDLKTQTKLAEKLKPKHEEEVARSHQLFEKLKKEDPDFARKLQRAVKEAQLEL